MNIYSTISKMQNEIEALRAEYEDLIKIKPEYWREDAIALQNRISFKCERLDRFMEVEDY